MYNYNIAGLTVSSEIVFPGAIAGGNPSVASDVTVREAPVPEALEEHEASGPSWAMAGCRFLLRIPDVARFLVSEGRDIAFETENGTSAEDVAIFLCGTVFGILLHQRGLIVLHASAVRVGDKAVLFCGPSGAGKSTLAAALVNRGYPLMTDDFCVVAMAGTPTVQSDGRQLKLWAQAIDNLDMEAQRGQAVRNKLEKFYVEPGKAFDTPLSLGALYALRETRPPLESGIERPNIVDAALILRRNAYRPLLVQRMGQKADYFHAAATIANKAGIFHLTRALDFKAMADVIRSLEEHWHEIGLRELGP
ncbi:MAG: hypothetical protein P4L57_08900 [Rhizomicrobium sp.]|nr:hypothetical protein [Rhizomicrobium sp.]